MAEPRARVPKSKPVLVVAVVALAVVAAAATVDVVVAATVGVRLTPVVVKVTRKTTRKMCGIFFVDCMTISIGLQSACQPFHHAWSNLRSTAATGPGA